MVNTLIAQSVKNLPAMQETWVQSLGREDSLEKEMATHSGILAWRIPWREEPGRLHGVARVVHDLATKPPPPLVVVMYSFRNFDHIIRFLQPSWLEQLKI